MRNDRGSVSLVAATAMAMAMVLAAAVSSVPAAASAANPGVPGQAQPPPPDPYAGYPDRTVTPDPDQALPPGGPSPLASGPTRAVVADPDTIAPVTGDGAGDGYVTYGTTVVGFGPCGEESVWARWFVPFVVSGSGDAIGLDLACITGDAMPAGPGAWAEPEGAVWAPSVVHHGGRYVMYYTASKRGSGQKCIGKAGSASPLGPFADEGEVVCPGNGRWAFDPDAFVHAGELYMVYRDDAITTGADSGISVVRMDGSGAADLSTRRDVLRSTDITWEEAGSSFHTIENPTMMDVGGAFHVFFSGNDWDSARYSTGIAVCSSPLPTAPCSSYASTSRPYFGHTGPEGIDPIQGLPGNERGPGGMSLFRSRSGEARVVWHFLVGTTIVRRGMAGTLAYDGNVWTVS